MDGYVSNKYSENQTANTYNLFSTINHYGRTMDNGHYKAHCLADNRFVIFLLVYLNRIFETKINFRVKNLINNFNMLTIKLS